MYDLEGIFWGHEFDIRPEGKGWEEARINDYIILRPMEAHDAADKPIYQDDILMNRSKELCRVVWERGLGFRKAFSRYGEAKVHGEIAWRSFPIEVDLYIEGWTIVGNWYENKSLFDGNEKPEA